MSYTDTFHRAVAEYLREVYVENIGTVTRVTQETESSGFCDTCYFEYEVLVIDYVDTFGVEKTYTWTGNMADLITYLTD